MIIKKPTTITTPDGQEVTTNSAAQGSKLSDGANDRIIMGFQKGGFGEKDFGFKVSQEGYDVKTADDSQLIMSSAFNMFKILKTGTLQLPLITSPSTYATTIDPIIETDRILAFDAYLDQSATAGYLQKVPVYSIDVLGTGATTMLIEAQGYVAGPSMYINIQVINNTGSDIGPWGIRWYVFAETAT